MTISIALLTPHFMVMATDRRLSSSGTVIDDEEFDKTCLYFGSNARFVVSFTGIARYGDFNTHTWMVQSLNDAAPPDFSTEGLIERLRDKATATFQTPQFRNLAPSERKLSILMAGYIYYPNGLYLPTFGVVSNYQRLEQTRVTHQDTFDLLELVTYQDTFDCFEIFSGALRPEQQCTIFAIGDESRLDSELVARLVRDASKLSPDIVALRLVHIIRRARTDKSGFSSIGSQVTSSIIPANPSEFVRSAYHSAVLQQSYFMPAFVGPDKGYFMLSASMSSADDDAPPILIPVVGRNKLCPCGSGKRYKYCHRKQRSKPPQKNL